MLERAIQVVIVVTVVGAVLAAGAILPWLGFGRKLRWVGLFALAALALLYAFRRRGDLQLMPVYGAAGVLLALAFVSAAWSASPLLTIARSLALALLFVACGALAQATAGRTEAIRRVLEGVLAATAAVGLGGLLVLLFRHDRAVAPATTDLPARYQGLGGGPDTAMMVLAVGMPLAAHAFHESTRLRWRLAAGFLLALLVGSIVASGSRGALAGGFAGVLVYSVVSVVGVRRRVLAAAVVLVVFGVSLFVSRIPDPKQPERATAAAVRPAGAGSLAASRASTPRYLDANEYLRLQDDVGHPPFGEAAGTPPHTIFGTSGRAEAWQGAIDQGVKRPLLGYGFGTEARVFVDRFVGFNSSVPENSYIGLFLQVGLIGLGAFLALVVLLLVRAARALPGLEGRELRLAAACAGGLVVGLVLCFFQSYIYAVGSNATAAVWICGFLLAAATPRSLRHGR